jgi:hypothetical protein
LQRLHSSRRTESSGGRLATVRLLAEHGADLPMPELPGIVAADCPRMHSVNAAMFALGATLLYRGGMPAQPNFLLDLRCHDLTEWRLRLARHCYPADALGLPAAIDRGDEAELPRKGARRDADRTASLLGYSRPRPGSSLLDCIRPWLFMAIGLTCAWSG